MKKIAFISALVLSTFLTAEAQYFVGGSLGFNYAGGKFDNGNTSIDKTSITTFSIAPRAGKFLSDKIAVGVQLGLMSRSEKTHGEPEEIDRFLTYGFTPFGRYYAFRLNKLSLFAQADFGLYFGSTKNILGSTTTKGPKTTTISLNAFPGIAYDLNEKISLEAVIGGFNFGISRSSEKINDNKDIDTNIGFGVNMNSIVTSGAITVGAIIKF